MNRDLIKKTAGRFFRIVFIKRTNGERRVMIARTGVSKGVTGVGLKFNPADHGLAVVWDAQKHAHRMVNLNTVQEFSCGNLKWSKA